MSADDPTSVKSMTILRCEVTAARRSALSVSGSPVLLGAGASLAAAFLARRMAAGDPVVLQRLMMLLTAPLKTIQSPAEV